MKVNRGISTIALVILTCFVGFSLFLLPAKEVQARVTKEVQEVKNLCIINQELKSDIPANPILLSQCNEEKEINNFAWQTFVALNWPADCKTGEPQSDPNIKIGDAPNAPRVWEFYNGASDIFLANGNKPENLKVVPPNCTNERKERKPVFISLSETEPELADQKELVEQRKLKLDGLNRSAGDIQNFVSGIQRLVSASLPLIDRWGNYILNENRMNPVEVQQILDRGWYSADNFSGFNNDFTGNYDSQDEGPFALTCGEKVSSREGYPCRAHNNDGEGAIEIKAAWMVLCDKEDLSQCYSGHDSHGLEMPNYKDYYRTERTFEVER